MSYREKESFVNIFSGLLITAVFAWEVYQRQLDGKFDLTEDFSKWGTLFLIFIGVSIVSRIVIYIIFHIINAIATREEDIPIEDERDKLIKLKATRNSHYVFSGGFVLGIVGLSLGMPVYGIFIAFILSGLLSEIVDNGSQIYFLSKGDLIMASNSIQNNIRRLRFNADEMTQQELADKAGISRQTVVAMEKGNYSPSLELAFRLAHIFSTPLDEVFTYDPEANPPKTKKK